MTDEYMEEKRVYRSPAKQWDVFLSHASEDKPYVRAVADVLRAAGLTVFIDEHDLVAGRSLRGQVDHALINSRLGLLFVSSHFLCKRWPREEFDALFTLEDNGQTKILPVWLGISLKEIVEFSPMLASRVALHADADPSVTAKQVLKHVEKIYNEEGSWAQFVRIDTLCLPWVQRPRFLAESLKVLDDFFPVFFIPWRPARELPDFDHAPTLLVGDLVMQGTRFDGQCVIVSGRQEGLQFYERRKEEFTEYVFQLRTRAQEHKNSIVYVRYVVADAGGNALPYAPAGHLTTAIGVVIASGAMTLSDGSVGNCVYMVAAEVLHMPEIS
jgi:hypothetical protein